MAYYPAPDSERGEKCTEPTNAHVAVGGQIAHNAIMAEQTEDEYRNNQPPYDRKDETASDGSRPRVWFCSYLPMHLLPGCQRGPFMAFLRVEGSRSV